MKKVFSSHNITLVHHSRNLLEAEGIHAEVRNQILSSAMGELPPAECQAEVWVVDDANAPRADLLVRYGRERQGPPWTCAGCGEVCEPQFTQCWKCGALRALAPA